jgi:hypothetical protein
MNPAKSKMDSPRWAAETASEQDSATLQRRRRLLVCNIATDLAAYQKPPKESPYLLASSALGLLRRSPLAAGLRGRSLQYKEIVGSATRKQADLKKTRIVSVAVQVRQPGETGVPGRHQKRAYPKAICNWHSTRKPRPREMWRSRVPESKSAMDHKACRRLPRKISISQAIFHTRLPEKGDTGGGATAKPFPHSQAPHANHPGVVKIPYLEPVRTRARNGKQGGKLDSNPVTLGR